MCANTAINFQELASMNPFLDQYAMNAMYQSYASQGRHTQTQSAAGKTTSKFSKSGKPCCPKKAKNRWMEGTLNTNYKLEYVDKEVPMVIAGKTISPSEWAPKGRFEDLTTAGEAFIARMAEQTSPFKPKSQTIEAQPFRGTSQYSDDFQAKNVPYVRAARPLGNSVPTGPFIGSTTYGSAYLQKEVTRPQTARPAVSLPDNRPFEGSSLYKETFVPHGNARRDPVIPVEGGQVMPRDGVFVGDTTSRMAYLPKEVKRTEMFRPALTRPMSALPFNGSSEYREQFLSKESPTKVVAHIPIPSSDIIGKGRFDDSTTSKDSFMSPAGAVPVKSYKPEGTRTSTGPFAGSSTYADAFVSKAVPYQLVRPTSTFKPSDGVFDDRTSHRTDYIPISSPPVKAYKPNSEYSKPNTAPFAGSSTYNDAFIPKAAPRTAPYLPVRQSQQSAPFQGQSSYKIDYVAKEVPYPQRPGPCSECSDCAED